MSDHDPFDGIYESAGNQPSQAPEQGERPTESAGNQPVSEVAHHETYSHAHLESMRKAELQGLARERNLDTEGTRDELIERVEAAQAAG